MKMGFGKLLTFKVDGIPSKLAHYVVEKFKAKKMEIRTPSGNIKVDKDSIHSHLGGAKRRLRIRGRLEIKGKGIGKGRFKGLTISINNQTVGEMEDISLEFQGSLMERHELILQVKPVWPQDNSLKETNSKIGDVLKKINEEIVDGEIDGVNENEMEDNNIDIALHLEVDDNLDVSKEFQKEKTEIGVNENVIEDNNIYIAVDLEGWKMDEKSKECKHIEDAPNYSLALTQDGMIVTAEEQQNTGQNVEAWNTDFDKVPEVPKTVYIQKEVEEINQQTDNGTKKYVNAREKDVDVVEARKTTVDVVEATSKSTSVTDEEGVKNVDDNDGPNYSLGLTQDGLILTPEGQINKDKEADEEVQKENEILGGEEDRETDIPLNVEPISQYLSNEVESMKEKRKQWEWVPVNQDTCDNSNRMEDVLKKKETGK
ncbi:hypothetical protein L1987_71490 [Smallanthus sonchifolius]|uniref:Uncharacterized protein n=1 Tax=Smallanthus sonchifolius TaxID=185202 RepID=A0ACB9ATG4_9ASTR|nr:hypothetical protein L1987_71490 [Smallanthus sonchifolius]